jgi:hypothetical protein
MIEAAILLGRHVSPSYYADAERFGRNHLLESQLLSLDQLNAAVAKLPEDTNPPPHDGRFSTTKRVADTQIGAFAARSTLNDAFHTDAPAMMQCCNAAGARALFDLWRYAVDDTTIHMRFSVDTPAVRVVSHEPARGQLDIVPKRDGTISVRLPTGVMHGLVAYSDGAQAQAVAARNGYIDIEGHSGQAIHVHYELPEHTAHYEVGTPGKTAHCTGYWRGETLLRVDPPGEFYPLYQRTLDSHPAQPELPSSELIASLGPVAGMKAVS